jgi:hypothetical protein
MTFRMVTSLEISYKRMTIGFGCRFPQYLARRRKYSSQLLNVHGVNYVSQAEIHTAGNVSQPSAFEIQLATEKLQSHKSPDIDQIPAELLRHGVEQFPIRSII